MGVGLMGALLGVMRHVRSICLRLVIAAAAVSALVVAIIASGVAASAAAHNRHWHAAGIDPMLSEHFGIFRVAGGARMASANSGEVSQLMREYGLSGPRMTRGHAARASSSALPRWIAAQSGMNMAQARFVAVGNGVWVVPGTSQVCISSGGGGGCSSPTSGPGPSADDGGLFVTQGPTVDQQDSIFGLAPDGNSTVRVGFANGSSQSVPVQDNVYAVQGPDPVSITLRTASGSIATLNFGGS
jgi:hypothetical protein